MVTHSKSTTFTLTLSPWGRLLGALVLLSVMASAGCAASDTPGNKQMLDADEAPPINDTGSAVGPEDVRDVADDSGEPAPDADTALGADAHDGGDSEVIPQTHSCPGSYASAEEVGEMQEPAVVEASGLVASWETAGVIWLHNDSGDQARLYALSETGAALGQLELTGVDARDFEDIAVGRCPGGEGGFDLSMGEGCLWVADMGNNSRSRDDLAIYVVQEPALDERGLIGMRETSEVHRYPVNYPDDEGIDSEGFVVSKDGESLFVFEKVDALTARVFRYPLPLRRDQVVTLEQVTTVESPGLPINKGYMITGADLHPSGRRLLLRLYVGSFEYRFEVGQGVPSLSEMTPLVVEYGPLSEPQGEAIGFATSGRDILTVSEDLDKMPGQPLHRYRCQE